MTNDIIKSIQDNCPTATGGANILKNFEKGGEGSKGGYIVSHTKSGKPIYDTANHKSHKDFTSMDHKDAAQFHNKQAGISESRRDDAEGTNEKEELNQEAIYHGRERDKHEKYAKIEKNKNNI